MKRASRAKLALTEGFNRVNHILIMGGTETLHDPGQARGVRIWPVFIGIIAETQPGHFRIAAGTEHTEGVDTIKHPASQAHGLEHEGAGITTGGKLGGKLSHRPLLHKGQRPGIADINNIRKFFNTGDGSFMNVVKEDQPILEHIAEVQEDVLGQVAHRNDQKSAGGG